MESGNRRENRACNLVHESISFGVADGEQPWRKGQRRMSDTINFIVNGQRRTVTTDPGRALLDVLREDLQLTGAKYGCGEGQCRACTVLLGGKSVASCLTSVGDANNETILTIEGLAKDGTLHPVQDAFLAEGAFQCGYCTSG